MKILITGASGFIGQELATSLLRDPPTSANFTELLLTDLKEPPLPSIATPESMKISTVAADLTDASAYSKLLEPAPSVVYLLHGIMSGAAEADLALGMSVNLSASLQLITRLITISPTVKVVMASVLAAYGPPSLLSNPGQPINETNTAPNPQSSYGTQKVMIETLLNDFSRRGLIDARVLRLPTIMPRAGAPTGAASSFASDIIREPLNGRKTLLPVGDKSLINFICSPRVIIENFKHAMTIPKENFDKYKSRVVIMPGSVATVQDILDAVVRVSPKGDEVLELIEELPDQEVERIVGSWPNRYDTGRAKELGFMDDAGLEQAVREYYEQYIKA